MTTVTRPVIVLAGGGTAGHVMPALAIADALVALGVDRDHVRFMGTASGMESTLVPAADFALWGMALRNFRRSMHPRNLLAAAALVRGVFQAVGVLGRWSAGVVISVGGFASVPAVVAARLRRIPVVVVSYDASPGLASRLAARVATTCAVAFDGTALPRAVVTGAPIRPAILAVDRRRDGASARAALGIDPDRFLVVAVGGSLGSGKINAVIDAFVIDNVDRRELAVHHVIGARNADGSRHERHVATQLQYQVVPFEDHIDRCLAACDLLVARAGASTVAEVGAVGVPAILVPWPGAAADHQRANAEVLSTRGGALLIDDDNLTAERLTAEIDEFIAHPDRLSTMADKARAVSPRDGAARIARLARSVMS